MLKVFQIMQILFTIKKGLVSWALLKYKIFASICLTVLLLLRHEND